MIRWGRRLHLALGAGNSVQSTVLARILRFDRFRNGGVCGVVLEVGDSSSRKVERFASRAHEVEVRSVVSQKLASASG